MNTTLPRARMGRLAALLAAPHTLLVLDCDGTLAPIVSDPAAAAIPDATRATIAACAALPNTSVLIISGRSRGTLTRGALLGDTPGLSFASSHGHFVELAQALGGFSHVVGEDAKPALAIGLTALSAWLSFGPAGLELEDTGLSLSLHYRNMAEPTAARLLQVEAVVDEVVAASRGALEKRQGKCVWELRPRANWGKGEALKWILAKVLALHGKCGVLVCGDDITDEDMFSEAARSGPGLVCEAILVCPPLEEGGDVGTVRATAATSFVSSVRLPAPPLLTGGGR